MDVRVDADSQLSIADRDDKVGGLPANAGKTEERLNRIGDPPAEPGEQVLADLADGSGLGLVETDRVDRPRDLQLTEREHRIRPIGKPIQSLRGFTRDVILGLLAQDARDQNPKRIAGLLGDLPYDGRFPYADSVPDPL